MIIIFEKIVKKILGLEENHYRYFLKKKQFNDNYLKINIQSKLLQIKDFFKWIKIKFIKINSKVKTDKYKIDKNEHNSILLFILSASQKTAEERIQYKLAMLSNIGNTTNNFFIELCFLLLLPFFLRIKSIINNKFRIKPIIENNKNIIGTCGLNEYPIIVLQFANVSLSSNSNRKTNKSYSS